MKNLIKVVLLAGGLSLAGSAVKAQQKLGHINSAELVQAMPEIKTADATMETWQKAKQTELELMNTEYTKKSAAIAEKQKVRSEANKDLVDKELQSMFVEIQEFEKRIGLAQESAQQAYQAKRDEVYNPILQKASAAMEAVAKEKGYAYVFDVSNPAVVYFGGGDDLQPAVRVKLGLPVKK
jgi:outer membrane protein